MTRGVRRVHHTGSRIVSGLTLQVISLRVTTTGNLPFRLGSRLKTSSEPGKVVARPQRSTRSLPRGSSLINDDHCVISVTGQKNSVHVTGQGDLNPAPVVSENSKVTLNFNVDSHVANAHIVTGLPQRKGVNPTFCQMYTEIKYVKNVSCVGHLCCVDLVTNAQHAVIDPPVGARLKQYWEKWESLGSSPKVVTTLRECYTLPFRYRPYLTRSPTVISNYHNPTKQSFLVEALYQLINKNAVEPVENQNSLGFYNRLFLVPKPNNRWRPILDLSTLNTFLNTESFKMETPETIRTSLQAGEWVTSIDFKDAYFYIPIHSQSRKYMRFHLQGRSYQFKALPFGQSTAPMEFTVVAKEVKLMALQKGIRTHQYLDDWLVRASTHNICLQHTQTLVTLCQELGWLVNKEKSELAPKQVFNFIGYQFDLKEGKVRPTEERWQTLTDKIRSILSDPVCPVRQFMSLISLLTATEKQVHLGRLHMRPIQWHLKNNWRVPESLDKVIPVPKSLHPHLRWWLEESNVLPGQPLHQVQQQTATVCVTGSRPPGLGSGCTQPLLGGPGPICLSTSSHLGQSGGEVTGLPLQQNNSDCPRVAQHALVLGSSGNVQSNPTVPAQHTKPGISAIQPGPSQESVKSELTCLVPRASAIKEQGFSEAVAARIEAPQRGSTRSRQCGSSGHSSPGTNSG